MVITWSGGAWSGRGIGAARIIGWGTTGCMRYGQVWMGYNGLHAVGKGVDGVQRAACAIERCGWGTTGCMRYRKVWMGYNGLHALWKGVDGVQRVACAMEKCGWGTTGCMRHKRGRGCVDAHPVL